MSFQSGSRLRKNVERICNKLRKTHLDIAVIGKSRVGKSSFINTLLGLSAQDEGGAQIDDMPTSRHIIPYSQPSNKRVVFWKLPGVGTPGFPRRTYLRDVDFDRFDFFLILSDGRFSEDDQWLVNEISNLKKKFHFVRTKLGLEVANDRKRHPETHSKSTVIERIRYDCLKNLEQHGLTEAPFFLIDSDSPLDCDFDFNVLATELIKDTEDINQEAMALSLMVLTEGVIDRKKKLLEKRIYQTASMSAIAGGVPVPGVAAAFDDEVLLREFTLYKYQFGLDDETMEKNARLLNKDPKMLPDMLDLQSTMLPTIPVALLLSLPFYVAVQARKSVLLYSIPIIGSIISSVVSFAYARRCLMYLLNLCYNDALKINQELTKSV